MSKETMNKPVVMIAMLVIGLVLLGFGIHLLKQNVSSYIETTAVITRVDYIPVFSKVFVEYTVDGKLYEDIPLGSYVTGDTEGKEVIIYYDPEDPTVIESQGGSTPSKFCILFGVVMTIYGFLSIYRNRRTLFLKKAYTKKKK